ADPEGTVSGLGNLWDCECHRTRAQPRREFHAGALAAAADLPAVGRISNPSGRIGNPSHSVAGTWGKQPRMARIDLENVSLTFQIRQGGRITLKEFLIRNLFRRSLPPRVQVHALQDVSLQIREGQRVGVIGHNGAGKSTLLKVLAGIYPPTRGKRVVQGHISSLFDISLGFEQDANGWENIAYRGYLQGETPKSIKAKLQPIAEFSELGDFLDLPVRYYSAGMLVRLAFSIATAIDPEVLLIDEVLGVGDLAFQPKAGERMRAMMARARLIVVVSHDMTSLAALCDRIVWLDHGRVRQVGPADEVIAAYMASVGVTPPPPPPAAPQPAL